jgi:hypothetical protein
MAQEVICLLNRFPNHKELSMDSCSDDKSLGVVNGSVAVRNKGFKNHRSKWLFGPRMGTSRSLKGAAK